MATPAAPPETAGQRRVTALDTVLASGTVAASTLAPVAISAASDAAVISGVRKAAEVLAGAASGAGDRAAGLILDALPDAPEARAADRALLRKRAAQFKVESVKRIVKGARDALREPTRRQVLRKLEAQLKASAGAGNPRRTRALAAALKRAQTAPSPRSAKMRAVIAAEGRYAAAHAAAQVARASGAADQAALEIESPDGAVWETAEDDRVTPDCAALHGRAIPHSVLRVHRPPLHANCRCRLRGLRDGEEPLSHEEASNLLAGALALHEDDLSLALLALSGSLQEALSDGLLDWDPHRHPRDTRGRFRETLAQRLKKGLGLRLPDGITVKPRKDGLIQVTSSGKITRHKTLDEAVADALDRSARKRHPGAVGGERSFKSFDEAVKDPGTPFESGVSAGGPKDEVPRGPEDEVPAVRKALESITEGLHKLIPDDESLSYAECHDVVVGVRAWAVAHGLPDPVIHSKGNHSFVTVAGPDGRRVIIDPVAESQHLGTGTGFLDEQTNAAYKGDLREYRDPDAYLADPKVSHNVEDRADYERFGTEQLDSVIPESAVAALRAALPSPPAPIVPPKPGRSAEDAPKSTDLGVPTAEMAGRGSLKLLQLATVGGTGPPLLDVIREHGIDAESFPSPKDITLPSEANGKPHYAVKTPAETEVDYKAAEEWFRKLPVPEQIAYVFRMRSDAARVGMEILDEEYPAKGDVPALGHATFDAGTGFIYKLRDRMKGEFAKGAADDGRLTNPEWDKLVGDPSMPGTQARNALKWSQERGIDLEQHAREETEKVRKLFDPSRAEITVRINRKGLNGLLTSGRFKTQHEIGRSSAYLGKDTRAEMERNVLGFPEDGEVTKRPVFGYLSEEGEPIFRESGFLNQYGDVRVVLKNDVRPRTTVTSDDSLDGTGAGGSPIMRAMPIDSADWRIGRYTDLGDAWPAGSKREKGLNESGSYMEAQIHGGVSKDDVKEIVLNRPPEEALRKKLDKSGIPWHVQDERRRIATSVWRGVAAQAESHIGSYESQIEKTQKGEISEYEKRSPEEIIAKAQASLESARKNLAHARAMEEEYGKLYDEGKLPEMPDPKVMSNNAIRERLLEATVIRAFTDAPIEGVREALWDEGATRGSGRDGAGIISPRDSYAARAKWRQEVRAAVERVRAQGYVIPEPGTHEWYEQVAKPGNYLLQV